MASNLDLQPGDKIWAVPTDSSRYDDALWLTVERVGRKWVYFKEFGYAPACIKTLQPKGDGYVPSHRYHRSKRDWERAVERRNAWDAFRFKVRNQYAPPPGVTVETIAKASGLIYGDCDDA